MSFESKNTVTNYNMKKQIILFISVILLGIVTVYIMKGDGDNRPDDDSLFKVEKVSTIQKILLANINGSQIILEKKENNEWIVNGQYRARPEAIKYILETIKRVEVNYPVPESASENTIKTIATTHVKVELYDEQNNIIRSYFVGGPTQNYEGTLFYMEHGERPYVCHIPGFSGYLTVRYLTELKDWRDRTVVAYKPQEIKSVKVVYQEDKAVLQSFELSVISSDSFLIKHVKSGKELTTIDKNSVRQYLTFFKQLGVEGFENSFPQKDSILMDKPFCTINITDQSGHTNQVTTYFMDLTQRSKTRMDDKGQTLKHDLDRLYASVNNGNDFAVIQLFVFGKLMQSFHSFSVEGKVQS